MPSQGANERSGFSKTAKIVKSSEVAQLIEENYPGSYQISNTCFLVRADEVSDKVANNVGIKGRNSSPPGGVVFKLNTAYAGLASSALWEWLTMDMEGK